MLLLTIAKPSNTDLLFYSEAVAVVADTEDAMIVVGHLLVERSLQKYDKVQWLRCINHLLQLVTKIALLDIFILEGRVLKPILDVTTKERVLI